MQVPYGQIIKKKDNRMKRMFIIAALAVIASCAFFTRSSGQITNRFNLYYEDLYSINPAAAGEKDYFNASLNTNLSNTGFEGSPETIALLFSGPLNQKTGVGLQVIHDSRGAFKSTNVVGSYAYSLKLGSEGKHVLNLGLSAGFYWQNFNRGEIDAVDMDDEVLSPGSDYYKKSFFVNEVGALYSWKNLLVSVSAPYLAQLNNHYRAFATYGYQLPNMKKMKIYPQILYRHLPENVDQLDAGIKFKYNMVWASVGYRTDNSILSALGIYYKKYRFTYSYNFNNSPLAHISTGTHEIMLSYNFNLDLSKKKASYDKKTMPWEEKED
jgi:type IX secretion system PorP/SprF family membrane protein